MASAKMMALQKKIEAEASTYQKNQKDLEKLVNSKQTLLTQMNENEMVKEELGFVEEDASIYKLVGPALLKQDPEEAKQGVNKRIEYLSAEISRVDKTISIKEKEQGEIQKRIRNIQKQAQTFASQAQAHAQGQAKRNKK